jgi:hypothetical protein
MAERGTPVTERELDAMRRRLARSLELYPPANGVPADIGQHDRARLLDHVDDLREATAALLAVLGKATERDAAARQRLRALLGRGGGGP